MNYQQQQQPLTQVIRPLNSSQLLSVCPLKISKTKKICTLGPKSSSIEDILMLIDHGVNVARLNFSHGTHDSHFKYLNTVREALKQRPGRHMSILLDTKGPEIRTGKNSEGKNIVLQKDQQLAITTNYDHLSTNECVSCSYSDLANSVKVGSTILFADGKISSIVTKVTNGLEGEFDTVTVRVLNDGEMGEKKNMCLPGCEVKLPTINQYDRHDIMEFGLKHKVDYIAISFARFGTDLKQVREMLASRDKEYAGRVQLISKIENHQAIENLQEIIQESNGVMVARGDLGMETPLQKVVLIQKLISSMTISRGKTLIVATQMLESMESKPRPTRAEVADITNAVLDLADATMTSGETANGLFPKETVEYMKNVSIESERVCDYRAIFQYRSAASLLESSAKDIVRASFDKGVNIICVRSEDPNMVRRISSGRPQAYIFVFAENSDMKLMTALDYGVYCFEAAGFFKLQQTLSQLKETFGFPSSLKVLTVERSQQNFELHQKQLNI